MVSSSQGRTVDVRIKTIVSPFDNLEHKTFARTLIPFWLNVKLLHTFYNFIVQ